jgi:glycine/D-amino acid oxidase-like deaminating enzyme
VGFDRAIDPAIVQELQSNAERLFEPLQGLMPEPWIGFRPATSSYQPEIRPLEDTAIWLACGHFRNGILLAPETARRVTLGLSGAS